MDAPGREVTLVVRFKGDIVFLDIRMDGGLKERITLTTGETKDIAQSLMRAYDRVTSPGETFVGAVDLIRG